MMTRQTLGLVLAGALWLGQASAARAQFTLSVGSPLSGGGAASGSFGAYGSALYPSSYGPYAPGYNTYGWSPVGNYYNSGYSSLGPTSYYGSGYSGFTPAAGYVSNYGPAGAYNGYVATSPMVAAPVATAPVVSTYAYPGYGYTYGPTYYTYRRPGLFNRMLGRNYAVYAW